MIAKTQQPASPSSTPYTLSPADLEVVLAVVRGGTLAAAGERLGVDGSTIFRSLQRLERGIGQPLFERSRAGYAATEAALQLAGHAEDMEAALEAARSTLEAAPEQVSGVVRLTTTDTVLHGLIAPALRPLKAAHPLLHFDLNAANELASLTRRDADIAIRATKRPPQHLVGKQLGVIRVAVYASSQIGSPTWQDVEKGEADWVAPDESLPDHPSVMWRKRHFPKVMPRYRVNSIVSVQEMIALGLGVGIVPLFLAENHPGLKRLTPPLDECENDLWLLTHPESRHLRRIAVTYAHLAVQVGGLLAALKMQGQ